MIWVCVCLPEVVGTARKKLRMIITQRHRQGLWHENATTRIGLDATGGASQRGRELPQRANTWLFIDGMLTSQIINVLWTDASSRRVAGN